MHRSTLFGSAVARHAPIISLASGLPASAVGPPHRPGLYWICAIALCERLASYMVFSLLVLYLNEYRGLDTGLSAKLVSYIQVLSYVAGVLGGVLSDRGFGTRGATLAGLILLGVGYGALGFGEHSPSILWAAVVFLVAGSGLFRPNITALVGAVYSQADPRRASAFRGFYYSVNAGALLGPCSGGLLRTLFGWETAFQAATGCMATAAVLLVLGKQHLADIATTSRMTPQNASTAATIQIGGISSGARASVLGLVMAVSAVFAAALSQSYGTLMLWARDDAERTLAGYEVPPNLFAALPAAFVLVCGPLVERVSKALMRRGYPLTESGKFTAGMLWCAFAYVVMLIASLVHPSRTLASPLWLVASQMALALGEILGVPVGLSLAEALAQSRSKGLTLGLSYGAQAVGYLLGGAVSALWPVWQHAQFFSVFALGCLIAAALIQSQAQRFARALPTL